MLSTALPPHPAEAMIRLLRTVLDEALILLHAAGPHEELLVLEQRIERARREAEALAPDFPSPSVRNGASAS